MARSYATTVSTAKPGGLNTYVQFNDSSIFGGSIDFAFDKVTKKVGIVWNVIDNRYDTQIDSNIVLFNGNMSIPGIAAPSGQTLAVTIDDTGAFSSALFPSQLFKETPMGSVDDSNTIFTVSHEPFFINVNGAIYEVGTGTYSSYSSGTITLSGPVGTGGFIRSYYQ